MDSSRGVHAMYIYSFENIYINSLFGHFTGLFYQEFIYCYTITIDCNYDGLLANAVGMSLPNSCHGDGTRRGAILAR